jgi:RNA polymerase sigma-70 factor, ECF subfamily
MIQSMSELAMRLVGSRPPPKPPLRAVPDPTSIPPAGSGELRLREMVENHFDFVWRNLRRVGVAPADADEFTQEAFLVASRRLSDILPECERAFLLNTALRIASTHRRSANREQVRMEMVSRIIPEDEPNPEQALDQRQARAELDRVLGEMELDLRTVFVLYELEELTVPQISELLSVKPGTVASRLRRAREEFCTLAGKRQRAESVHSGTKGETP